MRSYIKIRGFGLMLPVLASLVILSGLALSPAFAAAENPKNTIVYGKGLEATTIDPNNGEATGENAAVCTPFYETLVFLGKDRKPYPWLSTHWESSDDYKTWTFHLRKGIKFHNGESFTAEAVRFSYERLLKGTGIGAIYADYADEYSCKVVDTYTVRFDLKKPFPIFAAVELIDRGSGIVSPKYVKEHATSDDPYAFTWMADHVCGTGPFKFQSWQRGQKLTYVRNNDYWGGPQGVEGAPRLPKVEKVVELVIPESSSRRMAIEAGEIDIAEGLTPDEITELKKNPDMKIWKSRVPGIVYMAYDVRHAPFDDKLVRKAISYAINYEEIIQGPERGFAERLWSVMHNGALGDAPDKYVKYFYNPEKARQLLKQSGHPNGFKTNLYYASARRAQFEQEALLIQGYLKDIGIDVKIRQVAFPAQLELMSKGNYGLVLMVYNTSVPDPESGVAWRISPDRDTGGWDATYWQDPVAHNTTKARMTGDTEERARLYRELAIKAAEEAIYVPLFQFSPLFVLRENIEGFYYDRPMGPMFWNVTKK